MKKTRRGSHKPAIVPKKSEETSMPKLREGQRVKFFRTHDKTLELTGTITQVNEDSTVNIETQPDGKAIEVGGIETAHADDVTPLDDEDAA
jgi:hypothetical protein